MISPLLRAEARDVIDRLAAAGGGPTPPSVTKLQLLASPFYEGLRSEYHLSTEPAMRERLAGVLRACRRAASAPAEAAIMITELQAVIAGLESPEPRPTRPVLRVIQGGLA